MSTRNDNWLECTLAKVKIKSILDTLVWEDQVHLMSCLIHSYLVDHDFHKKRTESNFTGPTATLEDYREYSL
jgi:hypothetical protein